MWHKESERVREDVAVLMKDEQHSALIRFGFSISKILQRKFSKVEVCMVPVYGSTEGEVEERERFWNDLDWVVDTVGIVYMLCVEIRLQGIGVRFSEGREQRLIGLLLLNDLTSYRESEETLRMRKGLTFESSKKVV